MLILKNSCFIHIPKTGGSWVKQALLEANIKFDEFSICSNPHIGIKDCPCPKKVKFAFVRHPVAFYKSYWQYKMTVGWHEINMFDMYFKTDIFDDFIIKVTNEYPGYYGNMIDDLVGKEDNQIEFIGKQENITEDLITILRRTREVFDEDIIRATPPYNVSNKINFPAIYTEELKNKVIESENYVIKRFNYDRV